MNSLEFGRCALSMGAAAVLLAGCGGSQPPIGAPGAMPQSRAIAQHDAHGKSWMLPEAVKEDLTYLSAGSAVYVFGFHSGKLVGMITGFYNTAGLCVNHDGDVFVTDAAKNAIFEFGHGKYTVKRILSDTGYEPLGCAADNTRDDLAVANYCGVVEGSQCSSHGNVAIFNHARGQPQYYSTSSMDDYGACDYDNLGNLYVSGDGQSTVLARLSADRKSFDSISVKEQFETVTPLQWDGAYLTLANTTTRIIYRFAVKGRRAIETGSTTITNAYFFQYWITNGKVMAPAEHGNGIKPYKYWIYYYDYPSGGLRYTKRFTLPASERD